MGQRGVGGFVLSRDTLGTATLRQYLKFKSAFLSDQPRQIQRRECVRKCVFSFQSKVETPLVRKDKVSLNCKKMFLTHVHSAVK